MNSLKGYQNYQHAEEASENQSKKNSIGISDVIHSMGAVFHIIQSFPKLSKSFNQKFSFDETNPFLSSKGQIISKANFFFFFQKDDRKLPTLVYQTTCLQGLFSQVGQSEAPGEHEAHYIFSDKI